MSHPRYVDVLRKALQKALPNSVVEFEQVRGSRYRFMVIDESFDTMGHPERQRMVWDITEKALADYDVRDVVMIITMSVEELPPEDEDFEKIQLFVKRAARKTKKKSATKERRLHAQRA